MRILVFQMYVANWHKLVVNVSVKRMDYAGVELEVPAFTSLNVHICSSC